MNNELIQKWTEIQAAVESQMFSPVFNTWIRPLKPLAYDEDNGILSLEVPNENFAAMLDRYTFLLENEAEGILKKPVKITFVTPVDPEIGNKETD